MKNLEQIIKQEPVFLNNWSDKSDMLEDFDQDVKQCETKNILFASYGTGNYSGDAFVLYEEDGELFEINGSHCSCYGLENQWEPESTNLIVLEQRLQKGNLGEDDWSGNVFKDKLMDFLGVLQLN